MNYFTEHNYCLKKRIDFVEVLHCLTKRDRTRWSEHHRTEWACIVGACIKACIHSVLRMDNFTLHIIFSATVSGPGNTQSVDVLPTKSTQEVSHTEIKNLTLNPAVPIHTSESRQNPM